MKTALLYLALSALGLLIGFSWQEDSPVTKPASPETTSLPEQEAPDSPPSIPRDTVSPAEDWQALLADLPEDEWDVLLPLAERLQRYQRIEEITHLLEHQLSTLDESTRKRVERFSEILFPLLGERGSEIDPRAAIDLGLDFGFTYFFPPSFHKLANAEDFEALYRKVPSDSHRSILRRALPELMKDRASLGIRLIEGMNLVWSAYQAWTQHDTAAAAAHALTRAPSDRLDAMRSVAFTWVQQDPDAAIQWARSLPVTERRKVLQDALARLADRHPKLALKEAIAEADPKAVSECVWQHAQSDLDSAFAASAAVDDLDLRQAAMISIVRAAAEAGNSKVISQTHDHLPVGTGTGNLLGHVIRTLRSHAPEEAIAWLQTTDDREMFTDAKAAVLETWIQRDLRSASAYAAKHPELLTNHNVVSNIAMGLASADPREAMEWTMNLTDQRMRNYALDKTMASWAAQDHEAATLGALELDPADRERSLYKICSHLTSDREADVTTWLATLPETDRPAQTARAAAYLSNRDIREAFQLLTPLLEQGIDSREVRKAVPQVVGTWAQHEPLEAADWLAQLTDYPEAQASGMAAVIRNAAGASQSHAFALVDQLEPGPVLDQAITGLVDHIAQYNPQEAYTRAIQIGQDTLRHSAIQDALLQMARIDLPKALALLSEANLPAERAEKIRGRIED